MDVSTATPPTPEILPASALFLMTRHAGTRCPLPARRIAPQRHHLAPRPGAAPIH
jgi:hypothetical protein